MGIRAIGIGLAVLLLSAGPAGAQYFGSNKVQYETFDFQVLHTEHFDIHYYVAEQEAALAAAAMAERWYTRLSRALDHILSERTPIVLYASPPHFRQTTVLPGLLPDGVGGFTDHLKGRVVLPFAPALGETEHVLGHELVHVFQRDILQQAGRSMVLPLWFLEGMAESLTLGGLDAHTTMWIRDAVDMNRLPAIRELHDPKWFPYRFGQALWAFLADAFGEDIARRALTSKANGGGIGRLVAVTGVREAQLTARWHASMRQVAGNADPDASVAELLIAERRGGGRLNVGPALSPDGSQMVFLSERDRYSVDVFLADGRTGRVRRKLVTAAGNARFDSLQFVDSAGAWDQAGKRFAFAALQHGEPVLTILSMPEGDVERDQAFPDLDQIFDPTWSPSGDQIAFSGLRGGVSDLYVFDLETAAVRRLTSDGFADLQPAWSPDGRTLAFTTDRFTSSLEALTFGDYRLAALDLESGELRELPSIVGAKNIDPQWIGNDLLFVADADGVSDVFRLDVSAGAVQRLTNERLGVSGITALSPALSVAPLAGRVAYSAYRNGGYEIRTAAVAPGSLYAKALSTPAAEAPASAPELTPAPLSFPSTRYRGGLSLNSIGQPYLSAGTGPLGGFFRAGISVSFSDLLEQRQLHTAVQVGTSVNDFAFQTAYVNRRSRWTWGLLGAQLPISLVSIRTYAGADPGTIEREMETLRQTHRQGMMMAAYPFSRARRVELTAGVHTIGFGTDLQTRRYARSTGNLIGEWEARGTAPRAIALVETGAALVSDSSVAGATAPVLGSRSRFEIAPTFGDLSFVTLTADYRRYMMLARPLTVAMRVEHVGRYGADATDGRLLPLVWTVRDLVRGHSMRDAVGRSCSASTCEPLADAGARRLSVANVELRVPFVGPLGVIRESGPLPIDAFVFADAGWFESGIAGASHRSRLSSVGGGVRLNATGFVFEFASARAHRGWALVMNFRPGF